MQPSLLHSRWMRLIGSRVRQACCTGLLAVAIRGTADDSSSVQFGPPSGWVKPRFFDQRASTRLVDIGADQHWLLMEHQINALQNETFTHSIRQILTMAGVEKNA